jgi:hypothetical protein
MSKFFQDIFNPFDLFETSFRGRFSKFFSSSELGWIYELLGPLLPTKFFTQVVSFTHGYVVSSLGTTVRTLLAYKYKQSSYVPALAAWFSGIFSAGDMGREIESRQGIGW